MSNDLRLGEKDQNVSKKCKKLSSEIFPKSLLTNSHDICKNSHDICHMFILHCKLKIKFFQIYLAISAKETYYESYLFKKMKRIE